jgi:glycosyltransferase involved in cell wall biosynthesis
VHALLSHPYFWPYVARGAEREVHDVGAGLVARGHRVDLVTGQPRGLTRHAAVDGVGVRYVRTVRPAALARRGWQEEECFVAAAAAAAALSRADVALAFHYADAVGIAASRRVRRPRRPLVLKLTGTVPRDLVDDKPVVRRLLGRALEEADEVWVNSRYAADVMSGWGREMAVVPAGLDDRVFVPTGGRAPYPQVLCTAAPGDRRKRVEDLVDAWPAVLAQVPDARLVLAGPAAPATVAALRDRLPAGARDSVSFPGTLAGQELVRAYSSAWTVVMPSVYEALGLVTLEALACGTPVAGARSGATPELLEVPGTGVLFEPLDPASCAAAVLQALASAHEPGLAERCRTAARRYALADVLDQVEERLRRVARR